MKKFVSLALAMIMIFTLAACAGPADVTGNGSTSEQPPSPSVIPSPPPSPTPSPSESPSPSPSPLPNHTAEQDSDWQAAYRELLLSLPPGNIGMLTGYAIALLDLTFTGIPELLVTLHTENGSAMSFYYFTGSGAACLDMNPEDHFDGYYSQYNISVINRILLLRDRETQRLQYAFEEYYQMREVIFGGAGTLDEVVLIDGVPTIKRLIITSDSYEFDDNWNVYNLYQEYIEANGYDEAGIIMALADIANMGAIVFLENGGRAEITAEEYIEFKRGYFAGFDNLAEYCRDNPPPVQMNAGFHSEIGEITDMDVNDLFDIWENAS
jgi:hypothetical protein